MTYKQGDIHPETGMVFWSRQASCKNGERWMTPEKFVAKIEAIRAHSQSDRGRLLMKLRRNTDAEREKRNAYLKSVRQTEAYRKKAAARQRERRRSNHLACIADRVRARVREALLSKGISKRSKTSEVIGCSWDVLVSHLESRFQPGMSWDNRDEWHVDHIVPLSSATDEEEMLRLAHYTNLRPLWAMENFKKGASLPAEECLDQAVYLRRAIDEIDAEGRK